MAFNVNEFSAKINQLGLAQSNLFVARITVPDGDVNGQMDPGDLQFLCRTADIPDFTLGVTPFRPRGIGPAEQRPTTFDYGPLNLVFMVDSNFEVLKFYHRWMQKVVNYDVSGGSEAVTSNGTRAYEFGYRDEYAAVIDVKIFSDTTGDKFYEYRFQNAFPTTIGQITTAWENGAEVLLLPVTFAYDEMKVTGAESGTLGPVGGAGSRAGLQSPAGWFNNGFNPSDPFNSIINGYKQDIQASLQSRVNSAYSSISSSLRNFFSL